MAASSALPFCRLSSLASPRIVSSLASPRIVSSLASPRIVSASKPKGSFRSVSSSALPLGAEPVPNYVRDLETKFHDGELSPVVFMTMEDMVSLALKLARLDADTIDAEFSACSHEYIKAVGLIAWEFIDSVRSIVRDGDGHVLFIYGLSGCNANIGIIPDIRRKILKLPLKPDQVVDMAKEVVSYERSIGMPRGYGKVVMAVRGCPELLGVNTQESSTVTSKMVQDHSGITQTHKANHGAKLGGTADAGSAHENGFDDNGKLSEGPTAGTKSVENGYGKESKDPCKSVKEDAEGKKPPASLYSRLRTISNFLKPVRTIKEQLTDCWLLWKLAPIIVLAVGVAMMYYGKAAAESTSHSA